MRRSVAVLLTWLGCGGGGRDHGADRDSGSAADASKPPSTAVVIVDARPAVAVDAAPPSPWPAGRPAITEDDLRRVLASEFECYSNGQWSASVTLVPREIKSLTISSVHVDGDYAVLEAKIEARHPMGYDNLSMVIGGSVKLRYHWEAEWHLIEQDSHSAKCQEK